MISDFKPYSWGEMVGPRDLSIEELERCGLALLERKATSGEVVIRVYCLRCGCQVSPDRRELEPDGWWACARGCNTLYAQEMALPAGAGTADDLPTAPLTRDRSTRPSSGKVPDALVRLSSSGSGQDP